MQAARRKVRERPPRASIEAAGPDEESVWNYPRPPRIERLAKTVEVGIGDRLIARSGRCLRVLETSSPPVIYLPVADLIDVRLVETGEWALCEWKGVGAFFDLHHANGVVAKAGWQFHEPFTDLGQSYDRLIGHVALFPAKFACRIDGVPVEPQPGDYYGGWITPDIKGPFKGSPGTEEW